MRTETTDACRIPIPPGRRSSTDRIFSLTLVRGSCPANERSLLYRSRGTLHRGSEVERSRDPSWKSRGIPTDVPDVNPMADPFRSTSLISFSRGDAPNTVSRRMQQFGSSSYAVVIVRIGRVLSRSAYVPPARRPLCIFLSESVLFGVNSDLIRGIQSSF